MMAVLAAFALAPNSLPALKVDGMRLLDPKGQPVTLKGCNLGNWLMLEGWMFGMAEGDQIRDQFDFESTLAKRFGEAERERLMDLYRSSWITDRDWPIIRSFGFNVVRLPMNYRLFEDDANPFKLRKDAWQWIDRAVDAAEQNGLYTILDMHGVQGGQSVYDHTGHSGQNKLWTEPKNAERLAWLWGEIAKRYRNRGAVLAYDVYNEPYGGSKPDHVRVFSQALAAIRKNDPEKLVFAHGQYDGFDHYGDPKANGWHNVGFQMHYYPGMFGNGEPTLLTHAKHLRSLESVAEATRKLNVPFLIGEMNVVFKRAGGPAMMRKTFDAHASYGWMTTMWSYKVLGRQGGIGDAHWGMVTNAKPSKSINAATSSKEEIEAWARSFATQEYEIYSELRTQLTVKTPDDPGLPELPKPVKTAPAQDPVPGWTAEDLGGARAGGCQVEGDQITLWGGGQDVWGRRDQGRFLHQTAEGDFEVTVTVESMPPVHQHAKGGLMVRESNAPDSAAWLLSVFPNGTLQFAVRAANGAEMAGNEGKDVDFPVRLRLSRKGGTLTASYAEGREEWSELGKAELAAPKVLAGPLALSHVDSELIGIVYRGLRIQP